MNKRILATLVASTIGLGGIAVAANSVSAAGAPTAVVSHDNADREAEKTALAELLGMTVDELHTAVKSGKSLAQIAQDQNVAVSKVIDLLVAQAKTKITQMVNTVPSERSGMRGGHGHRGFGRGNRGPAEGVDPSGA